MKEVRIVIFLTVIMLLFISASKQLHVRYKNIFNKDGFVVEIYETKQLDRKLCTRFPLIVKTDYKDENLFTSNSIDEPFTAVWKGRLHVREKGKYLFFIQCNDSFVFFVNGTQEMERHGEFPYFSPGVGRALVLDRGMHPIEIHHYQVGKEGRIKAKWTGMDIPNNTILGSPDVLKPLN